MVGFLHTVLFYSLLKKNYVHIMFICMLHTVSCLFTMVSVHGHCFIATLISLFLLLVSHVRRDSSLRNTQQHTCT